MSTPYFGSTISLISKSDIRYEGILYTIDPNESTIALAKARSYGTEDRPTAHPVLARDEVYEFIIFRANDIKNLIVEDTPPALPINPTVSKDLRDPAIIQVQSSLQGTSGSKTFPPASTSLSNLGNDQVSVSSSSVAPSTTRTVSNITNMPVFSNANQGSQGSQSSLTSGPPATGPAFGSAVDFRSGGSTPTPAVRRSPVSDAGVQIPPPGQREDKPHTNQLNRDGRNNYQHNYRGNNDKRSIPLHYQRRPIMHNQPPPRPIPQAMGFRGGRQGPPGGLPKRGPMVNRIPPQPRTSQYNRIPNNRNLKQETAAIKISDDYDFEKANKEFEELENKFSKVKIDENENNKNDVDSKSKENKESGEEEKKEDEENVYYDKAKSFFDKISCEAIERSKGKVNRVDWRKERKMNAETFGITVNNFRRAGYRGRGGYNGGYAGYSRANYNTNRRNTAMMGSRIHRNENRVSPASNWI